MKRTVKDGAITPVLLAGDSSTQATVEREVKVTFTPIEATDSSASGAGEVAAQAGGNLIADDSVVSGVAERKVVTVLTTVFASDSQVSVDILLSDIAAVVSGPSTVSGFGTVTSFDYVIDVKIFEPTATATVEDELDITTKVR